MKPTIRYLTLRGEVYQLRLPVPSDIQDRMGRKELRWSLHTKQKRLAEYRTWKAAVLFDDLCDSIRGMPDVDHSHVKALVLEFFEELKTSFKSPPAMSVTTKDQYIIEQAAMAEEAILGWQKQLHSSDFDEEIRFEANRFLKARGLEYSALEAEQRFRLLNGMTRAKVEYQKFVAQMLGDPFVEYVPSDQLFAGEVPEITGNEPNPQHSGPDLQLVTVGELAEEFIERGEKTGYDAGTPWKSATRKLYRRALPWFVEYVGAGTDIGAVNKNHVKQIRDKLVGRPSGLPSTTSVFDIPEAAGKDKVSKTTARNEFGSICKFLRWCASDGYIDVAPTDVEGIARAPADKVRPFEPKEVNLIFSSPVFAGCKNKRRRSLPGPHIMKDEVYWALLLLLFTGARTSDIAALYVEDVQLEHEIPHLRFRMREGNLKESASERDTPLHPELLEFGFAGFVDRRRKQDPSGFLFGRLKGKQELRETLNKRLNRYRKAIGLDYDKLGMHSFRHGMIDALTNSGCPESTAERLVGHTISTVHGKYGKGLSLEAQLKFLLEVKLHLTDETKNILRKPANA